MGVKNRNAVTTAHATRLVQEVPSAARVCIAFELRKLKERCKKNPRLEEDPACVIATECESMIEAMGLPPHPTSIAAGNGKGR